MKEFTGEVSITARINFVIEAENEEEAKRKLFDASLPMNLVDDKGKDVCVDMEYEWHMIDVARRGNIQETNIADFEIVESDI